MLPKPSAYVKRYDSGTKWMIFFIKDDDLVKKYNNTWNEASNSIKKGLDWEPIYNKNLLKTKLRSYGGEATDFHDEEMLQAGSNYICLEVTLIDF